MPIDPQTLQRLANPMANLSQLTQGYQQGQQIAASRETINAQKMKNDDITSKVMRGFTKGVMETAGENATPEEILEAQKTFAQTMPKQFQNVLGKMLKKPLASLDEVNAMYKKATELQKALHPEDFKVDTKSTYTLKTLIKGNQQRTYNAADPRILEKLEDGWIERPLQNPAFNIDNPNTGTARTVVDVMKTLKAGKDDIFKNIENENAYAAMLETEALSLQAAEQKKGKKISLDAAIRKAHQEHKDGLVLSDLLNELTGGRVSNPLGKKYIYSPKDDVPETETPTDEATDSASEDNQITDPSQLKEGEAAIIGNFEYKRSNGRLKKRPISNTLGR